MSRRLLLIGVVVAVVSTCDTAPRSPDPSPGPSRSPELRCGGIADEGHVDCLRALGEEAGYKIERGNYKSEIRNIAYSAMYGVCFQSSDLRSQLENSNDPEGTVEAFVSNERFSIATPYREAATAGCLLALEDLGLL